MTGPAWLRQHPYPEARFAGPLSFLRRFRPHSTPANTNLAAAATAPARGHRTPRCGRSSCGLGAGGRCGPQARKGLEPLTPSFLLRSRRSARCRRLWQGEATATSHDRGRDIGLFAPSRVASPPWPGTSSSPVVDSAATTPRARWRRRCRSTARGSRLSATSTSCSTRRCCPGRRRGRWSRATSSCRCASSSTARTCGWGASSGRSRRATRWSSTRSTAAGTSCTTTSSSSRSGRSRGRCRSPASSSTRWASRRCRRRSRCAIACCGCSRSPRRCTTPRRAPSTSRSSSSAPATRGSRGSPSCRTS